MVFSSLPFIFLFLPIFLAVYTLMPARWRNPVLFLGSLVFYAVGSWGYPGHLLLLAVTIAVDWLLAGMIGRQTGRARRVWLVLGLVFHFGCLFFFKYGAFTVRNINAAFGTALPVHNYLLPAGISFYTFQAVSYLVDVYRGTCPPAQTLVTVGTYLTMYPQLIAGPIVTYDSIRRQLVSRSVSFDSFMDGIRVFILGLGSKVLLANQLGGLWSDLAMIGYESVSTPLAWMGIAAFSFQLYFDFYGYSLMAIGLGQMLGFTIPENFLQPYSARSMSEFWRRWHVTLSHWFRDYVYIPLGGSRCGRWRTLRNLLVVWLFTGLWHGAGWNFALWGLVLFVLLAVEKFTGLGRWLENHPIAGHLYMLLAIPLTWTVFAITDMGQMGIFFGRLFPVFSGAAPFPRDYVRFIPQYGHWLLLGLLFSTPYPQRLYRRLRQRAEQTDAPGAVLAYGEKVVLLAIFWAAVYCLYRGLNDPFLYFRF